MNWIVTLFVRWLDRRKPRVRFRWSGGYSGAEGRIEFGTALTNDGTMIARGVVVRGFLDGEQVAQADPVDVPVEAPPIQVNLVLRRPEEADLSKALNDRPIFHGRRFTATATVGQDELTIGWPHEEEPKSLTPSEEEQELRKEFLFHSDHEDDDFDEETGRHIDA